MSELQCKRVLWTCYPLDWAWSKPCNSCGFFPDFIAVDSQPSSRVPLDAEDSMCQLKWLSRWPLGKEILLFIIFHITSKKNHSWNCHFAGNMSREAYDGGGCTEGYPLKVAWERWEGSLWAAVAPWTECSMCCEQFEWSHSQFLNWLW